MGNLITEQVSGGDVVEAIFLDHQFGLCALAAAGGTEKNDIHTILFFRLFIDYSTTW